MLRLLVILAWLCPSCPLAAAAADDALAVYKEFAAAQNAHDLGRVRATLLDSPRFLWVSDGRTFWGREVMLARMATFQKADIWVVKPDLAQAVTVEINADAAYIHLPLDLEIGSKASPETWVFLVSVLCVRTEAGWRIAALFTTTRNTSPG